MSDPLSHVSDTSHWHVFENLDIGFHLPLGLTKFMVLEAIAAGIILLIYLPLAKRIAAGTPPKGAWWNFWEVLLTFIRDEVAKPNIQEPHHHDEHGHGHGEPAHAGHGHGEAHADAAALPFGAHYCDKYVPFLWTMFLFILINNLLGMFPFMGSATGAFTVTCVLAAITFLFMHGNALLKNGWKGYLLTYLPPVEAPKIIAIFLIPMIYAIEVMGALIKCFVLSVRLFANMFAGHLVLALILMFIVLVKDSALFWPVTGASVLGVVALSLLELFVAFLQAFVFTFLTAIFLGGLLNPEH